MPERPPDPYRRLSPAEQLARARELQAQEGGRTRDVLGELDDLLASLERSPRQQLAYQQGEAFLRSSQNPYDPGHWIIPNEAGAVFYDPTRLDYGFGQLDPSQYTTHRIGLDPRTGAPREVSRGIHAEIAERYAAERAARPAFIEPHPDHGFVVSDARTGEPLMGGFGRADQALNYIRQQRMNMVDNPFTDDPERPQIVRDAFQAWPERQAGPPGETPREALSRVVNRNVAEHGAITEQPTTEALIAREAAQTAAQSIMAPQPPEGWPVALRFDESPSDGNFILADGGEVPYNAVNPRDRGQWMRAMDESTANPGGGRIRMTSQSRLAEVQAEVQRPPPEPGGRWMRGTHYGPGEGPFAEPGVPAWAGPPGANPEGRSPMGEVPEVVNAYDAQVGDHVFAGGNVNRVTAINRYAPGDHPHSPIRNDLTAEELVTEGNSRWRGLHEGQLQPGVVAHGTSRMGAEMADVRAERAHEMAQESNAMRPGYPQYGPGEGPFGMTETEVAEGAAAYENRPLRNDIPAERLRGYWEREYDDPQYREPGLGPLSDDDLQQWARDNPGEARQAEAEWREARRAAAQEQAEAPFRRGGRYWTGEDERRYQEREAQRLRGLEAPRPGESPEEWRLRVPREQIAANRQAQYAAEDAADQRAMVRQAQQAQQAQSEQRYFTSAGPEGGVMSPDELRAIRARAGELPDMSSNVARMSEEEFQAGGSLLDRLFPRDPHALPITEPTPIMYQDYALAQNRQLNQMRNWGTLEDLTGSMWPGVASAPPRVPPGLPPGVPPRVANEAWQGLMQSVRTPSLVSSTPVDVSAAAASDSLFARLMAHNATRVGLPAAGLTTALAAPKLINATPLPTDVKDLLGNTLAGAGIGAQGFAFGPQVGLVTTGAGALAGAGKSLYETLF